MSSRRGCFRPATPTRQARAPRTPAASATPSSSGSRPAAIEAGDGQDLHFWPHRLRHTLGTRMINDGVPQRAVQDYYGHASPEMTAHYAKLPDQTLRREDRRVSRARQTPWRTDRGHAGGYCGQRCRAQGAHRARQADASKRLLRHPDPEQVPAPQRLPVVRCLPHPDESFRPVLAEQRARARQQPTAPPPPAWRAVS